MHFGISEAATVLGTAESGVADSTMEHAIAEFALRSLDRLLAEAWDPTNGLRHVIAYSDPTAKHRLVRGMLDDYAYLINACLDAYEATADPD